MRRRARVTSGRSPAAERLPRRRIGLADRDGARYRSVGGRIGTCRRASDPSTSRSPDHARPSTTGCARSWPLAPTRDGSEDTRTRPSGARISTRRARQRDRAVHLKGEHLGRRDRQAVPDDGVRRGSRRRRSSVGRALTELLRGLGDGHCGDRTRRPGPPTAGRPELACQAAPDRRTWRTRTPTCTQRPQLPLIRKSDLVTSGCIAGASHMAKGRTCRNFGDGRPRRAALVATTATGCG